MCKGSNRDEYYAAQGRGWWVCECGHRNTGFAAACYGGCGKDRPETLDDATAQGLEVRLVPKESAAACICAAGREVPHRNCPTHGVLIQPGCIRKEKK